MFATFKISITNINHLYTILFLLVIFLFILFGYDCYPICFNGLKWETSFIKVSTLIETLTLCLWTPFGVLWDQYVCQPLYKFIFVRLTVHPFKS